MTIKSDVHLSLSDALRSEWETLWSRSDCADMFNSPGWFVAARKAFSCRHIRIIVLRDNASEQLVALVPLVKMTLYGVPIFIVPGYEFIDRFSPLCDMSDIDVVKTLLREFSNLGNVCVPGLTENHSRRITETASYASAFPTDENPYIDGAYMRNDTYVGKRKSRSLQKAERMFGSVTPILMTENHSESLRTAFEIDRQSSKFDKGKGVFWRSEARNFFLLLAQENPKCLFVELLLFGEIPVAYSIGFMHNGVYACSQKAHLSEYERYRPGGLAFSKFLETLAPTDPREVDIGRGYDRFKMDFTKTVRMLHTVIVSKSAFVRWHIRTFSVFQKNMYRFASSRPRLYRMYKQTKKCFGLS